MERYKVYIDGAEIDNPDGLRDFELQVKRDEDIAGLLVTSTNKFTFWGTGYDMLKAAQEANYNDKITSAIHVLGTDGNYTQKFKGVIILSDVKLNLDKQFAETTIEDANFQGAIQANKNIKAFIGGNLTKNSEFVTAITEHDMDYFNAAGNYLTLLNRSAWLYKDVLSFLVRYMTDDEVKGVQSIYLDDVSNFGGASLPYITTGKEIRTGAATQPNLSFSQLIQFMSRTHDLTFDFVVNSSGETIMRIEEREFFFGSSNSETIRDIKDLTREIDVDKLASHIEVGNNTTYDSGNCSATTRWFSFQKEDYALRGKGNIDKLIDLTTDFITDSNVIQEIVVNANTTWDDETIVVLGNTAGTEATKFQSTSYCANSFFYNLPFTNDNIISRKLGAMPESLIKFLQGGTTPCKAFQGTDEIYNVFVSQATTPHIVSNVIVASDHVLDFIDLVYDIGSNYVITPQTHYDIPFEGKFTFESRVVTTFSITDYIASLSHYPIAVIDYKIAIERWNTALTVKKEEVISPVTRISFGRPPIRNDDGLYIGNPKVPWQFRTRSITLQAEMDCDVSDRIVVRVYYVHILSEEVRVLTAQTPEINAYFKCLGADEDNGVFKKFDPSTFRATLYKFKKNISLSQGDNIRSNTRDSLIINERSDPDTDKRAWIEKMNQNQETGETIFTLIN